MAAAILRGDPDALLTQPKAVLPRLLAGESLAHGWGDLVTGLATLATLAGLDAARLPLTMLAVALGVAVYVSAAVTFASLAFWIAGARSFARDLTEFLLLFSTFPGSIYSGATRLIAFTVLPAGFVVLAPVAFVREPTPAHLAVFEQALKLSVTLPVDQRDVLLDRLDDVRRISHDFGYGLGDGMDVLFTNYGVDD